MVFIDLLGGYWSGKYWRNRPDFDWSKRASGVRKIWITFQDCLSLRWSLKDLMDPVNNNRNCISEFVCLWNSISNNWLKMKYSSTSVTKSQTFQGESKLWHRWIFVGSFLNCSVCYNCPTRKCNWFIRDNEVCYWIWLAKVLNLLDQRTSTADGRFVVVFEGKYFPFYPERLPRIIVKQERARISNFGVDYLLRKKSEEIT